METLDEKETEVAGTEDEAELIDTPKTGFQKFLRGFGKFMMMGGFIVILIFIAVIAVLIAYLTKGG